MTDCINCKAPLTETEKFCPSCGHAVNTVNNNLSNEDFQVKMFDTVISSEDQQLEIDKEAFGSTPVIEHEKILRKN